jgi:RimJ/RimL family protein N-acetyltransferase
MERIGMRDRGRDFDHRQIREERLRRHVLYCVDGGAHRRFRESH